MQPNERAALVAAIQAYIEIANRLMLAAQRRRFSGFAHPPMLFHWDDEWDDMAAADLLDVCAWFAGVVGRLEKYR